MQIKLSKEDFWENRNLKKICKNKKDVELKTGIKINWSHKFSKNGYFIVCPQARLGYCSYTTVKK